MISQDSPISRATDDKLNRSSFAKSLAHTLLNSSFSSSFTIGLYGEWGSGKTSLLNMVLEAVEEIDDSTIILKFNPWLCSDHKQLITQFFKQLGTAIKVKKPASDKAWELIDQYADIFDAASAIPVVGGILTATGKTLSKEARDKIEQSTGDLQKSKNQTIQKMIDEDLKIIVSIDDIDRLSEEEIIAVFQLVKSLADFPNTVYILAFDYSVVVRALSKVQHGDGKEYLEKVIQVPFEIPAASLETIYNSLFSKLNAILGSPSEEQWDRATWAELFQFGIKHYIKSIRDVVRYTNVFSLKYVLLKDETDPVDLLGLTCLQVFEPFLYSKLPQYKELLCGSNNHYSYELQKEDEDRVKKMLSALIYDNREISNTEAASKILGILFPRTQDACGISYGVGRSYVHRDFFINNNIAVSMCFDRYFALTLENDAISTSVIKHLIYDANELEFDAEVMRLYQEGKIIRMLEEIEAYANKRNSMAVPSNRAALIIKNLVRRWSCFEVDDIAHFSVPFSWRLLFCVDSLLNSMSPDMRLSCIRSVFEDVNVQPSTLALLLNDFEVQHGRFTNKSPSKEEPSFSLQEVLDLEKIFKERAVDALNSGSALQQPQGLNFLWMLEQIDPELVASKKKVMITDDISLIKVISYCTSHGTMAARTVSKTWNVDQKILSEFIDKEEAYRRVSAFAVTTEFLDLPAVDQMNAVAFLLVSERTESQSMLESAVTESTILKKLNKLTCQEP